MIVILILVLVIIIFSWELREREPVNEEKFNRREILFVKINSYFYPFPSVRRAKENFVFMVLLHN